MMSASRLMRGPLGILLFLLILPVALFAMARGSLALANKVLERRYPPPGRLVDIGQHRLHLFCVGSGTPTVIVEAGLAVSWVSFAGTVSEISRVSQICVYDRAGYGWSEPGPMPRTALQIATELHDLIDRAGIKRPSVLVAHSFGGYIARVYVSRYPDSMGGVVLVDPSVPESQPGPAPAATPPSRSRSFDSLRQWVPPLGWDRVNRLYVGESGLPPDERVLPIPFRHRAVLGSSLNQLAAEQSEAYSRAATLNQVRDATFPANVPLTVITPMYLGEPGQGIHTSESHRLLQKELAAASRFGKQLVAERSGHFAHLDQPELVWAAIREAVLHVRGNQ